MKRKLFWGLALTAIALTTGCGQGGTAQPTYDHSEQSELTTAPGHEAEPVDEDEHRGNDAKDPKQTTGPTDQSIALGDNDQQSQPNPTAEGETKPPDGGEDSTAPDQATLPGDRENESASGNGQQAAGGGGQIIATSDMVQQIPFSLGGNVPAWVTSPSPHDIESNERSYLTVGATASEGAEVVPANDGSPIQDYSDTQLLGNLTLLKIIRRYRTSVAYKAGGNFSQYSGNPWVGKQIQQMVASENISWEKTRLSLGDIFHLTPGVPYSSGLGGSNVSDFINSNLTGSGPIRHFTNIASATALHDLTPRSGLTFIGAYETTHYFGLSSLDSRGATAAISYNYQLTPRSNISASYGYQDWKFSGGQSDAANIAQFTYGYALSPRVDLTFGGGPQFISSRVPTTLQIGPITIPVVVTSHQTTYLADALLSYTIPRGTLNLIYEHLLTSGAGLFAGANTDTVGAFLSRSILRSWTTTFAGGFTRLSSLGNQASSVVGYTYQYGFANVSVNRRLGTSFNISANYQFNEEGNLSGCSASSGCGSVVHTALISISWHSPPFFLDRRNVRQESPLNNPIMDIQNSQQTLR